MSAWWLWDWIARNLDDVVDFADRVYRIESGGLGIESESRMPCVEAL